MDLNPKLVDPRKKSKDLTQAKSKNLKLDLKGKKLTQPIPTGRAGRAIMKINDIKAKYTNFPTKCFK